MPSAPFLLRTLACAALFSTAALADTITLKSGEKVEGKILTETATDITVAVKVSASITDERVIPKAEVDKVEKEQPDEIAWLTVKNIKLGQNSLPPEQYELLMGPLQGFVNDFPKSVHTAEAAKLLADIAAEKARVDGGEVRLGEKWLTAEEVGKERYQIQAQVALQQMRAYRGAGDFSGALNTFDYMEKNLAGAQNFPDAVEIARETLATLKVGIERAQATFKAKKAEFDAGLANAAPAQKAELQAARQKELARGEAALAAADKAKVKWPAIVGSSDKNLDAVAKKIQPEIQRLANLDLAKLRQAAELAETARKQIAENKPEAIDAITKAISLSPKNELARRLQADANALKTAAVAAEKAAAVAAKATPTPKPAATPRPRTEIAAVAPEPEKPFFLTVGGIITILVLLAVAFAGWAAYNKLRHRANDVLE